MTTREIYWIWQREQPEDRLITGKQKRDKPIKPALPVNKQLTNDERGQDEFLKRHGIC